MFFNMSKFGAAIAACLICLGYAKDLREYAAALSFPQSYGGKGDWAAWTSWSSCSASCGEGDITRTRQCQPRGFVCRGPSTETRQCKGLLCSVWRDWAGWTECSVTCGQGLRTRTRSCSQYIGCDGESIVREPCSHGPCPEWGPWTEWASCSKMCGGGERDRYRECTVAGQCTGEPKQSKTCNEQSCCTEWSNWSSCSVTCSGESYLNGVEKRSRRCTIDSKKQVDEDSKNSGFLGYASKEEHDERQCKVSLPPCAEWLEWTKWASCSVTCGSGQRTRERMCSIEGACDGPAIDSELCGGNLCPKWLPWSDWSVCDRSCAGGKKARTRFCTEPGECIGDESQVSTCNDFPCPVWSPWGPWSRCSESCNGGFQVRNRVCSDLKGCPGDEKEKQLCNEHRCPSFDQWQAWESCSAECGGGVKTRVRPCIMDNEFCLKEANKQSMICQCDGNVQDDEQCNTHDCPSWSQWKEWSKCSHSCGTGSKTRERDCVIDQNFCIGENSDQLSCSCSFLGPLINTTETANCNDRICPHWSSWQSWGVCSTSCGGGVQSRSRICIRDEIYCATASPGDSVCICEGSDQGHEQCNAHLCPEWNAWSDWTDCSARCDGGTKQRSRECLTDKQHCSTKPDDLGCTCDGPDIEEAECNLHICPKWEKWGEWTICSAPCDGGTQERSRQCSYDISWCDGSKQLNDITCQCFGNNTESQRCNQHFCPKFGAWSPWESCSVTCGGGKTHRNRDCNIDLSYCDSSSNEQNPESCQCHGGEVEEFTDCNTHLCPFWSDWGKWSSCSVSCGIGHKDRKRKCDIDAAYCTGDQIFHPECQCDGPDVEANQCNQGPCFAWSSWSSWSNCSHVCGGGSRERARKCPQLDACPGLRQETDFCNQLPCPDWGSWSEWSSCSVTCGGGQRARTRSCPLKGGCFPGEPYEAELCNDNICPSWAEWGSWGSCSAICGEGNRKRERICDTTDGCLGNSHDVEVCFEKACELFTHWSAWSPCSKTCGGGLKTRSRVSCPTCPSTDEQTSCEEQPCPEWSVWSPWTSCSKTCGAGQRTRDRKCVDDLSGVEVPQGCVGKKVEVDGNPCSPEPCISWRRR